MRAHPLAFASLLTFGLLSVSHLEAAEWAQWRGPALNGSSPETGLPLNWSRTNGIVWTTPLPGLSGATPAIAGDAVFVVSPDAQKDLLLFCIDRTSGKVRWQKKVATGDQEKGRNNMVSPSPVTDGKTVVVLFATGDLAAYSFEGKQLWARNLGKEYGAFANMWIYGSSPMLYGGKLYVQVLQRSPVPSDYRHAQDGSNQRDSYLLCIDPTTGKNLWRQIRKTDAVNESQEAYTTPIPVDQAGSREILVLGGDYLTAHNPDTGFELWRCGGLNPKDESFWRIVPSPVFANGTIIACAPKHDPVFGIRDGGKGLVTATHIAWTFKEFPSDCVTPLFYQGKLFVLDGDRQMMTCLDPKTGETKWQGSMGIREIFRASPTGADGKIYCIGESGTVVVLGAGDTFKILATIPMGESPVRSTIAAAQGQLYIRTGKNLYCIGAAGQGTPASK